MISSESAIPIMTSNTSPSGIASASSVYSIDFLPWKAFNGTAVNNLDAWVSANNQAESHIQYEFPNEIIIGKYSVQSYNVVGSSMYDPKDWRFEGFNEGTSSWDVLDIQTGQSFTQAQTKEYEIPNRIRRKKHRLVILSANGGNRVAIAEIKMFEKTIQNKAFVISGDQVFSAVSGSWTNIGTLPSETSEWELFYQTYGMDEITGEMLSQLAGVLPDGKGKISVLRS